MAMAARNSGGIVIAQVRQLATRGSLRMRDVKVPGSPRRPRLRRPGPVADLHHAGLAVLRGRPSPPGHARAAAAARRAQDHRPPLAARVPARRDLQPRLRDQPAHRPRRLGGGHHRPARADGRAGDLRRRARRRQRGRCRVQLPGDDRPALHVRLLRRRRARRREPVVRRGGRRGQRQRPRLRGTGPRSGRLPEHQREDRQDQLRRDADGPRPRDRDRRRRPDRERGQPRQVRARGPRDLVQRPARPRARPAGPLHHRAGRLRARGRWARPDRGRARHRRRTRRPRPDGLPAAGRRRPADDGHPALRDRPDGPGRGLRASHRERPRRARAGTGRAPDAREPAAQPRNRGAARGARRGARDASRPRRPATSGRSS